MWVQTHAALSGADHDNLTVVVSFSVRESPSVCLCLLTQYLLRTTASFRMFSFREAHSSLSLTFTLNGEVGGAISIAPTHTFLSSLLSLLPWQSPPIRLH